MKKFFIFLIAMIFVFEINTYATENDLQSFVNEMKQYSNEYFPELSDSNLLSNLIEGKITTENLNIFQKILNAIFGEFKNSLNIIAEIIGIAVICSIFKNIQSNFGESGISEISFYVCYILVIILMMTSFTNITKLCDDTVFKLNNFMKLVVPLVISLIMVSGNVASVAIIQPAIITMIAVITNLLSKIILPVILVSTVINIVTNISEHLNLEKISMMLKKSALWIVEIVMIIFVGVLSIEGSLSSTVDGITAKTAKTVVSSTVPVVGKILGDTVDSVIGGIAITKNAVGIIGVIAILAITMTPLIKTFILMTTFNLASGLIEPIADKRITKCMSCVGESIKIVFAILAIVTFLFIISITFMLKITNSALMYR